MSILGIRTCLGSDPHCGSKTSASAAVLLSMTFPRQATVLVEDAMLRKVPTPNASLDHEPQDLGQ